MSDLSVRSRYGIAEKFNLTVDKETDFTADILLTRRQNNEVKNNPYKYRSLTTNSNFDFLPKGSKDAYPLRTCPHRNYARIFEHNSTQQSAKFAEKTCEISYVDRFLNSE